MKKNWKLKAVLAALPLLVLVGCGSDDENVRLNQTLVRQHTCALPTSNTNVTNNQFSTFGTANSFGVSPVASFTLPSEMSTEDDTRVNVNLNGQTLAMNARASNENTVVLRGSGLTLTMRHTLQISASGTYQGQTFSGSNTCGNTSTLQNSQFNNGQILGGQQFNSNGQLINNGQLLNGQLINGQLGNGLINNGQVLYQNPALYQNSGLYQNPALYQQRYQQPVLYVNPYTGQRFYR